LLHLDSNGVDLIYFYFLERRESAALLARLISKNNLLARCAPPAGGVLEPAIASPWQGLEIIRRKYPIIR